MGPMVIGLQYWWMATKREVVPLDKDIEEQK
jgi:hypothetical protein